MEFWDVVFICKVHVNQRDTEKDEYPERRGVSIWYVLNYGS